MKSHAPLAATSLLCLSLPALAQGNMSVDEVTLRRVVQPHIDGVKNNDAESLRKSLHPRG